MGLTIIKKLPTPEEIIELFPVSFSAYKKIIADQEEVKNILSGKDNRFLVIVGPCSAWPYDAALEFAKKLLLLEQKLKHHLKIIMRVYIQKPRTTKGWTGPVDQPDPFMPPDIEEGIKYCRSLMIKIIEMGLPIANECVLTHNEKGFQKLLTWIALGSRSSEDQEHRVFASSIDCAVGVKNPTSGSIEIGVNSVIAVQSAHAAVFQSHQVKTSGNSYAHLILRGGDSGPNYFADDLFKAKKLLEANKIQNPAIIIDASHDNCKINGKKDCAQQAILVRKTLATLKKNPELQPIVKGFMIESFLKEGNQKIENLTPETVDRNGLSITDPCMSFDQTKNLLYEIADHNIES